MSVCNDRILRESKHVIRNLQNELISCIVIQVQFHSPHIPNERYSMRSNWGPLDIKQFELAQKIKKLEEASSHLESLRYELKSVEREIKQTQQPESMDASPRVESLKNRMWIIGGEIAYNTGKLGVREQITNEEITEEVVGVATSELIDAKSRIEAIEAKMNTVDELTRTKRKKTE